MALLPQALALFRAELPATALEFSEGLAPLVLPALREGLLDLALVQHRMERIGPDLDCEELLTTPLAICARVGHPRARARSLAALQHEEWVGWDRTMVEDLFAGSGVPAPERIVVSRSMEITRALVGRGDLISVFARPALDRELARHGGIEGGREMLTSRARSHADGAARWRDKAQTGDGEGQAARSARRADAASAHATSEGCRRPVRDGCAPERRRREARGGRGRGRCPAPATPRRGR